jgi:hypothetical protein
VSDPIKRPDGGDSEKLREQQVIPRDLHPIEAINPDTGKKDLILYIRDCTIEQTRRKGMGAARELAFTVPAAVQSPTGIFRGVTEFEEGDEDWLIFVARPPRAYDWKTAESVPVWKGEVFLVFVDEDRVIRRWYWDDASDKKNPRLPEGYDKGRFKECLL